MHFNLSTSALSRSRRWQQCRNLRPATTLDRIYCPRRVWVAEAATNLSGSAYSTFDLQGPSLVPRTYARTSAFSLPFPIYDLFRIPLTLSCCHSASHQVSTP